MAYPTLVLILIIFIILLEIIQFIALIYYLWTLCIRPKLSFKNRFIGNPEVDSKKMSLIQMQDYVEL